MNKYSKIGLFDSGLGGLSVLSEIMKLLPNEDYLFYEDSINNPYGMRTEEDLFNITSRIVENLLNEDCKIIVIACNTATTSCMTKLKEKHKDTLFVGTVPAIKVAYDHGSKNTIVLSTPYTTKSKRVQELIHDYTREDQVLTNISGGNLANLIELGKREEYMSLLHELLDSHKDADAIVLGCTHYSIIKDDIKEVLPNTELLDGCKGIANEVKRLLSNNDLLNPKEDKGSLEIINTKSNELERLSLDILKKL